MLAVAGAFAVLLPGQRHHPAAQTAECLTIADFANDKVGEFPSDWKARKDEGKEVYTVREEAGRRVLAALSRGLGIQAAKEREWDLRAYPVLAWSWRPREFPRGADERNSATNDSVLAVYMLVPHSRIRGPKAVKYIWSEKVPLGTHLTSNMGLTQVRVLRSGTAGKGRPGRRLLRPGPEIREKEEPSHRQSDDRRADQIGTTKPHRHALPARSPRPHSACGFNVMLLLD